MSDYFKLIIKDIRFQKISGKKINIKYDLFHQINPNPVLKDKTLQNSKEIAFLSSPKT